MLLGKRQRPPMKRTTSITEFTLDLNLTTTVDGESESSYPPHNNPPRSADQRLSSAAKPHRRNSADFSQTTHFLRACYLCKRRLISGRDIFMYRGDNAFCSLECRQQQMNQDEKKDNKCSISSNKHNTPIATASPNASETVAAM